MSFDRFMAHFAELPDPRVERTRHHELRALIFITMLAVICGEESWEDMAEFAEDREEWLATFMDLPHGVPCADTFRRVWSAIDPKKFNACFIEWMRALAGTTEGKLIAIDGKTVRGSGNKTRAALHLVNAWVLENNLVLGQVATEAKSNEITAIPELLALLEIRGAIVSIDAMGCQKEIAKAIVDKKADYLLAVKGNHPILHEEIVTYFADPVLAKTTDEHVIEDKGHGRLESRRTRICRDVKWLTDGLAWQKLSAIVEVESSRTIDHRTSIERRYFLTSTKLSAEQLGPKIRGHWGIENSVHWMLDVTFREDGARPRKDKAPENLALLRRLTMNLLKQVPVPKKPNYSIRRKRKRAARRDEFLNNVLNAAFQAN
jgi:predicted transposase YbfD/YdcC